ncbi:MAG: hypothetical protein ACXADX_08145 [Candidatus Hodarchaeales archaeon]
MALLPITAEYAFDGILDVKGRFDSSPAIPGKGGGDPFWPILYESTRYPECCGPGGKGGGDPIPPILGPV